MGARAVFGRDRVRWGGGPLVLLLMVACAGAPRPAERAPEGALPPCPGRPNCVCSEDPRPDFTVPPLAIDGSADAARQRLEALVQAMGGRIERVAPDYLHATFRSRIFRFVDDLECRLDARAGVIHLRSASRVGYSDLGVNRRRVEELRARWGGS